MAVRKFALPEVISFSNNAKYSGTIPQINDVSLNGVRINTAKASLIWMQCGLLHLLLYLAHDIRRDALDFCAPSFLPSRRQVVASDVVLPATFVAKVVAFCTPSLPASIGLLRRVSFTAFFGLVGGIFHGISGLLRGSF